MFTACTGAENVEVTAGDRDGGGSGTTAVGDPVPTSALVDDEFDPSGYLLTQADLPDWDHVGSMTFSAEPTYEAVGCELMATVWSAHARDGTRVRASTDGVALRHTVVEMPDLASAEALLDAVDIVWAECNPLTLDTGDMWWVEPIEVPAVDQWRTAGLALGMSKDLIWTISWFQQGTTVVFVDLDSANPWQVLEPVLEAAAGRLTGDPSPVPVREQASTTTTSSLDATVPGERPTSTSVPAPAGDDWRDHAAAAFVPDPTLFGPGYVLDRVTVDEREPSDPDDVIEGCPVDPPPQMDGLSVQYDHESGTADIDVQVGLDDPVWAQDTVDAFRALGSCGADALGVDEFAVIEPSSGADDAVVLDLTLSSGDTAVRGQVLVARYGDMLVSILVGVEGGSPAGVPSVDDVVRWADTIAAGG